MSILHEERLTADPIDAAATRTHSGTLRAFPARTDHASLRSVGCPSWSHRIPPRDGDTIRQIEG